MHGGATAQVLLRQQWPGITLDAARGAVMSTALPVLAASQLYGTYTSPFASVGAGELCGAPRARAARGGRGWPRLRKLLAPRRACRRGGPPARRRASDAAAPAARRGPGAKQPSPAPPARPQARFRCTRP